MEPPEVLPWVAVQGGRAVSPTGLSPDSADFQETVGRGLREHGALLLWDLEGRDRGKPRLDLYRRFEGRGLWAEAGIRHVDTLIDVLVAGADVAVLNLRYLWRLSDLLEAGELTDQVALCIEEDEGLLALDRGLRSRRPDDLFREAMEAGVERGVYLRHGGLRERPAWASGLEGIQLYVGPVPPGSPGIAGRVVDLWGLG